MSCIEGEGRFERHSLYCTKFRAIYFPIKKYLLYNRPDPYLEIEVCQSEKDGDIATKQKELELAEEEDFGASR